MSSLTFEPSRFDYSELECVLQTPSMWECVSAILTTHFKAGSARFAGGYALQLSRSEYVMTPKGDEVMLHTEGECSLVLEYDMLPIACISFDLESADTRTMCIRQMQGVEAGRILRCIPYAGNEAAWSLSHLAWTDALAEIVIEASRRLLVAEVRMLPAGRNREYKPSTRDPERVAINERLFKHYDETALRLGFTLDDVREWYVREL